jgi:hypothetical protein
VVRDWLRRRGAKVAALVAAMNDEHARHRVKVCRGMLPSAPDSPNPLVNPLQPSPHKPMLVHCLSALVPGLRV